MGPLIEGLLSAGSAKGGLEIMGLFCILIGIGGISTLVGMIACLTQRFQDVGRGLLFIGVVLVVFSVFLGIKAY